MYEQVLLIQVIKETDDFKSGFEALLEDLWRWIRDSGARPENEHPQTVASNLTDGADVIRVWCVGDLAVPLV